MAIPKSMNPAAAIATSKPQGSPVSGCGMTNPAAQNSTAITPHDKAVFFTSREKRMLTVICAKTLAAKNEGRYHNDVRLPASVIVSCEA